MKYRRELLAVALGCSLAAAALANPTGMQVVGGQVSKVTSGNSLLIANSPGAIINWQSFSSKNQALNVSKVIADSGKTGVYGALVNQMGLVSANTAVVGENGKIVFKALQTELPNRYSQRVTLGQCIANPSLAGCAAVLPTVAECTLTPRVPGCTAVLPSFAECSASPTKPGCSVVLSGPLETATSIVGGGLVSDIVAIVNASVSASLAPAANSGGSPVTAVTTPPDPNKPAAD